MIFFSSVEFFVGASHVKKKFREMNVFFSSVEIFVLEVCMTLLEQQVLGPVFS